MVVSKITLVQCRIQFQPNGRGTIPSSIQVLHVLSMKLEITLIEFSSLQIVKDTAEGFSVRLSSVERRRPNPNQRLLGRPDMQGEAGKRYTTPSVELLKKLREPGLINTAQ